MTRFVWHSLCLTVSTFSAVAQDDAESAPQPAGIIHETYELRLKGHKDLNLYLRYPSEDGNQVKGVLAICKYGDRDIEMDLTGGTGHFGYLLDFADQHGLATVAFGQPSMKGWNRTVSSDQLSRSEAADQDQNLDALAREWSRTILRFARRYQLPEKNWLMYGLCGGAQYTHRIALREPDLFKAVHVHYGGSYDVPTDKAKRLFWLVTSYADEPAYIAAQRFYQQSREKDYPMILKGYSRSQNPELFNDNNEEYGLGLNRLQTLSTRFFEYALYHDEWDRESENAYIADYVNGVVLPAGEASWIPRSQAIDLPSRELAKAWGNISE